TYFDTPDLQLHHQGLVLRVRRDGRRLIQTVKRREGSAAGLFSRGEWEFPVRALAPVVDERTPLAGALGAQVGVLRQMFALEVHRTSMVTMERASRIEIALDRGQARALDRTSGFTELELELLSGDPRDLFTLARRIDRIAPLRIGVLSKADRGFRLIAPLGRAMKAGKVTVKPEWMPDHACAAIMADCLRHYRVNEALLLVEQSGEALHQARVALRRLRSAHAVFAPLLRDPQSARLDLAVRRLSRVLGTARDLDVVWSKVSPETRELLDARREQAWKGVSSAIGAAATRHLFLDLAEWIQFGDWRRAPATTDLRQLPLRHFAGSALDRRRRQVRRHGHHLPDLPDTARHALRKDAKKLRYAAEFFGSLYGTGGAKKQRRRFLEALEQLQDQLGRLNDHVVEQALLGPAAPDHGAEHAQLLEAASHARHVLLDCEPFW
ncbi:MAG TPA: CHAD domain-containing protein, partial [Novosphingobium sp.]|nr:CHAD domain-containing protein [Novosphingobium sp.]